MNVCHALVQHMLNFDREFKKIIQELEEILANDESKIVILKDNQTKSNTSLIHRKRTIFKTEFEYVPKTNTKKNE